MVPRRIEFENYHSVLGVFNLIGIILPRTAKLYRCVKLLL
ncbi:hypothetical protein HMPREF9554_01241 [Treponema phagedenis F0421]|nr:hypothetical protein HMPREF9554_01241 [Treponema phagedenis F0421]